MYARDMQRKLHTLLCRHDEFSDSEIRFQRLRDFGLLPRGRQNASVRLSDEQLASSILGFASVRPEWAGITAIALGNLVPVGGSSASFKNADTLTRAVAVALKSQGNAKSVRSMSFVVGGDVHQEEYWAQISYESGQGPKTAWFVSRLALSLLGTGAEKHFDIEKFRRSHERQLVVGGSVFGRLQRDISVARELNLPLRTDWAEYTNEDETQKLHERLGAKANSRFLHLGVDTQVTWPKDPHVVKFHDHNLVLFPRTKIYSNTISIDLNNPPISIEAATTLLNRFLTLMSWCDDSHAILGTGWAGDRFPRPTPREELAFVTASQWIFNKSIPSNEDLLQRLAYYREGLNAGAVRISSYEVLSFYKVFEIRSKSKKGQPNPTKSWIAKNFDEATKAMSPSDIGEFHEYREAIDASIEGYIMENCRVATAHTSSAYPSDADSSSELRRLNVAAKVLRALARHYIKREFGLSDSYLRD